MEAPPLFTAISTSARQLFLLLRCISFAPRAEVQITASGLRFSAEEARVVQGLVFLENTLFSSFSLNLSADRPSIPSFQISLSALLETLQIFGISEASSYRNPNGGFSSSYATAFNTPALALGGTCKISYAEIGAPLSITISEAGVTTTCNLTTYEPPNYDEETGIPLDKKALVLKIIMRSTWLHDTITELSGTNPTTLIISASNTSAPYFAMEGEGGPFGDSTVDFTPGSKEDNVSSAIRSKKQPAVTETFVVAASASRGRVKQRYKFELIKKAGRAMALANKVSLRQDKQGVLSMQFMIELSDSSVGASRENSNAPNLGGPTTGVSAGGHVSFVDFRFVPLIDEDDDEDEDYRDGHDSSEE